MTLTGAVQAVAEIFKDYHDVCIRWDSPDAKNAAYNAPVLEHVSITPPCEAPIRKGSKQTFGSKVQRQQGREGRG